VKWRSPPSGLSTTRNRWGAIEASDLPQTGLRGTMWNAGSNNLLISQFRKRAIYGNLLRTCF